MKANIRNTIGNYIFRNTFVIRFREFRKSLFRYYLMNTVVNGIPSRRFRKFYYRYWGMRIGDNTTIGRNFIVTHPNRLEIGHNTIIGWSCHFQAQGGIIIGNNVNFGSYSRIWTGSHDINHSNFSATFEPVVIEDHAWVSTGVIILQGVIIGEGAVVMAGAVITKNVPAYSIVGGVPAEKKGERSRDLQYELQHSPLFY